jgi:PAS domain S-box-containing protein
MESKVIVRVSPAHERLLGYPPEAMVGRPAADFIVLQESGERAMDQKLAGTRELKPFVRAFKRADGSSVTMLLLDRRLHDRDGNLVGMRTVMTPMAPEVVSGS